jgi:Transposase IS200 like
MVAVRIAKATAGGKTKGKIGFHGGNVEIERPRLRRTSPAPGPTAIKAEAALRVATPLLEAPFAADTTGRSRFIPKCRRKTLMGAATPSREIFRRLAMQKKCRIEEGHLMPDHVHMMISIPPTYAVS